MLGLFVFFQNIAFIFWKKTHAVFYLTAVPHAVEEC